MKPTNATLNAILASRQFEVADLYQITLNLTPSVTLYFASGQSNITYSGNTYLCGGQTGPYFDRKDNKAKVVWKLGSGTDSLVVDVAPGSATVVNGLNWYLAAKLGIFDGADFLLSRAFMTTYGVVQTGCAPIMFRGRIAEIDFDRTIITLTVNDYRELFNQQLPRNLFQAGCMNTLGDASCTVNLASFSDTGTVSGVGNTYLQATMSDPTGFFDHGKIVFTSGQLNGLTWGVSDYTMGTPSLFHPIAPFPILPQIGDTFTAYAGCDRTTGSGGCTKFSNIANFRGFPYIPCPELAV